MSIGTHDTPITQGSLTRRTAVIGGGALLVSVPMPANAGTDDGALLAACERLRGMCNIPLPADDAEAEAAMQDRWSLFGEEIVMRRAQTFAGAQAQVRSWLLMWGSISEGGDDLAAMFGAPTTD